VEETPIFDFPYPEPTDKPDGPEQIEAAVKAVEERLAMIEKLLGTPAEPATPEPGELIVVNGTNDPVYRAITGDVGFNALGVATIGEERVATAMIINLAVTAAKLADKAVTNSKLGDFSVTESKVNFGAIYNAALQELAVTANKLAAEAVETGKIKALAVTEAKLAAQAVSDSKMLSPNNSVYRTILQGQGLVPAATVATNWYFRPDGSIGRTAVNALSTLPPVYLHFVPGDYAVNAKNLVLQLRAQISPVETATMKFTVGLHKLEAGSTYKVSGESVASVAFEKPVKDAFTTGVSADIAAPAEGLYALVVTPSASSSTAAGISAQLRFRHT